MWPMYRMALPGFSPKSWLKTSAEFWANFGVDR
jgi:hypothetical protein